MCHLIIQLLALGMVCCAFVDVKLLQVFLDRRPTMTQNLALVDLNVQIRKVVHCIAQRREAIACIKECFQDAESCLHVCLSPFPAFRVPELQSHDACSGHGQIRCVEYLTGFILHVFRTVPKIEDFKDIKITTERHGNAFGATFLIRRGNLSKHATPGLAGLVVGVARLPGYRIYWRLLGVEIILPRCSLLQKLAGTVEVNELALLFLE